MLCSSMKKKILIQPMIMNNKLKQIKFLLYYTIIILINVHIISSNDAI